MFRRLRNRFKFFVERMLLRGAHYRLLVIAALVGLVAGAGGMLVQEVEGGFSSPTEAIWWAFLRLTDPGYLGDDEGLFRRLVSTAVTVSGYVIFMGALIAIMTQWFAQTMRRLESGLTPIAMSDHVLILGWTNRTAAVVEELLLTSEERVRRFLRRHGARRLNIVILAEEVDAARVQELRDFLGDLWDRRRIIFRTGTPLNIDHLRRVDFLNASAIIRPGEDIGVGGAPATDTRTIKTLLTIGQHIQVEGRTHYPLLVTEIFDARKVLVAAKAYRGSIEVLGSDLFVSRLIAQTVRHPGLSHVYNELLGGQGNEVYIRGGGPFTGMRFQDLGPAFSRAIPIGVLRPDADGGYDTVLNPPAEYTMLEGDRLVLLATEFVDTRPPDQYTPTPQDRSDISDIDQVLQEKKLLVLGWSHKAPALLREFDGYRDERFAIDVLAYVPIAERQESLKEQELRFKRVKVQHHQGDFTVPAGLEQYHPENYDQIVLLGSDWLESETESDARTLLGYLLLRDLIPQDGAKIMVELMDPENTKLLQRDAVETLVSPRVMSHMLAQVALRPELRRVFDELFGPGGAEITFQPVARYGLAGQVRFASVQEAATARGEVALGLRLGGVLHLNPDRESEWTIQPGDELVTLITYAHDNIPTTGASDA